MNKVMILGRATGPMEMKSWPSGGKYCSFSLATEESFKDKTSGEWKKSVEFHNVVVSSERLAESLEGKIRKGTAVFVMGSKRTREWQGPDGAKKKFVQVSVFSPEHSVEVIFDPKPGSDKTGSDDPSAPAKFDQSLYSDDEIPF